MAPSPLWGEGRGEGVRDTRYAERSEAYLDSSFSPRTLVKYDKEVTE